MAHSCCWCTPSSNTLHSSQSGVHVWHIQIEMTPRLDDDDDDDQQVSQSHQAHSTASCQPQPWFQSNVYVETKPRGHNLIFVYFIRFFTSPWPPALPALCQHWRLEDLRFGLGFKFPPFITLAPWLVVLTVVRLDERMEPELSIFNPTNVFVHLLDVPIWLRLRNGPGWSKIGPRELSTQ